jgi:ubiquinone/menaquinone biosynthesis C-methylase UbiE
MEQFEQKIKSIRGGQVLEIGCGSGGFTNMLLTHLQGITEYVATDPDSAAIGVASGLIHHQYVRFEEMRGENIAYPDSRFDTVCVSNSLHHVQDVSRVFAEMARVLKTGGTFIVAEIYCDGLTPRQERTLALYNVGAQMDTLLGRYHNQILSREMIVQYAMSVNLQDIDVFDFQWVDPDFTLEYVAEKYRNIVAELKTCPEYDQYHRRVEDILRRLSEQALDDVPELAYIGKKT